MLLDQDRSGEAQYRLGVGEDADDAGAPLELLADPLERVGGPDLPSVDPSASVTSFPNIRDTIECAPANSSVAVAPGEDSALAPLVRTRQSPVDTRSLATTSHYRSCQRGVADPATPAPRSEPDTILRPGPCSPFREGEVIRMRRGWAPAKGRHARQRRTAAGTCHLRSRAPWGQETHSRADLTQLALEPNSDLVHALQAAPAATSDRVCPRAWAPLQQSSKVL